MRNILNPINLIINQISDYAPTESDYFWKFRKGIYFFTASALVMLVASTAPFTLVYQIALASGKTKKDDTLDQDNSHTSNSSHAKTEGAPFTSQPPSTSDCMSENASNQRALADDNGLTSTLLPTSGPTSRPPSFARKKVASGPAHQSPNNKPVASFNSRSKLLAGTHSGSPFSPTQHLMFTSPGTPTGVPPLPSADLLQTKNGSPSRLNAASLSRDNSKTDNPIAKVWGKVDSDSESDCSLQGDNVEYY